MTKTTIIINGRTYDAITGMPVVTVEQSVKQAASRPAATQQTGTHNKQALADIAVAAPANRAPQPALRRTDSRPVAHQTLHQPPQKSQTLYRKALKKPAVAPATPRVKSLRSPMISRFGTTVPTTPKKAMQPKAQATEKPIQHPVPHPTVAKALQAQAAAKQAAQEPQPTGKELKELLIKERLNEVGNTPGAKQKKASWLSRQPRVATILTTSLAILVLGGYLTYIALPTISLKVAASRAGVNASMPEYKPDGYSLDGPITYSPGEVVISYKSNTNDTGYKLTQKATNWDSQAVLDNYVERQATNYLTFQERGITVYTFGNKAAWVNGGLLYTLDGDAALSSDQILRVATSM